MNQDIFNIIKGTSQFDHIRTIIIECIKRENLVKHNIDDLDVEIYLEQNFELVNKLDYFTNLAIEILKQRIPTIFVNYKNDWMAFSGFLDKFLAWGWTPIDAFQSIVEDMNLLLIPIDQQLLLFKNYNNITYYLDDILDNLYYNLSDEQYRDFYNRIVKHFYSDNLI